MALVNPIYNVLSQAEAPPRDAFIDSFNANNLMLSCDSSYMADCRRSSILGSSNSVLINKFNTHVIGEDYQSQDFQIINIYNAYLNNSTRYYIEYLGDESIAYNILNSINTSLSKNYSIDWAQVDEDVFYVYPLVSGGTTYYLCRLSDDFIGIRTQLEQRITYSSEYTLTFGNFGQDGYLLKKDDGLFFSSTESILQGVVSHLNYVCRRNLVAQSGAIIKEYSWLINNIYEDFKFYDYRSSSHRLYVSAKNGINITNQLNKNSLTTRYSRSIVATGDVIANNSSDERLKENIKLIKNTSKKLSDVRCVSFEWNNLSGNKGIDLGLIAQQIECKFPELTQTRNNGIKSINYKKMTAILVACVKERQQRIDKLNYLIDKINEPRK